VWLSEIMLQQTQVDTVIPYYGRFLARFPDLPSLAAAPVEDVLTLWSGLGYYARARNLHKCAQAVMVRHGGVFPADPALLAELPGIGRSTAAAISAFAYGTRAAILDGNVKRVLARAFGIEGFPGSRKVEDAMWALADSLLPEHDVDIYTQAQMDLGATVCTRGRPLRALPAGRQLRGAARRAGGRAAHPAPQKVVPERRGRFAAILAGGACCSSAARRPASGAACRACPSCPRTPTPPTGWPAATASRCSASRRCPLSPRVHPLRAGAAAGGRRGGRADGQRRRAGRLAAAGPARARRCRRRSASCWSSWCRGGCKGAGPSTPTRPPAGAARQAAA
jgi:A/G-specific adenine glycosylase